MSNHYHQLPVIKLKTHPNHRYYILYFFFRYTYCYYSYIMANKTVINNQQLENRIWLFIR